MHFQCTANMPIMFVSGQTGVLMYGAFVARRCDPLVQLAILQSHVYWVTSFSQLNYSAFNAHVIKWINSWQFSIYARRDCTIYGFCIWQSHRWLVGNCARHFGVKTIKFWMKNSRNAGDADGLALCWGGRGMARTLYFMHFAYLHSHVNWRGIIVAWLATENVINLQNDGPTTHHNK